MTDPLEDLEFEELPESGAESHIEQQLADLPEQIAEAMAEFAPIPPMAEPVTSPIAHIPDEDIQAPGRPYLGSQEASEVFAEDYQPPTAEFAPQEEPPTAEFADVPPTAHIPDEEIKAFDSLADEGETAEASSGGDRELLEAIRALTDEVRQLREQMKGQPGSQESPRKPGPQADGSFVPMGFGGKQSERPQKDPRTRGQMGLSASDFVVASYRR